jgi:hypothetical protein
MFEHPGKIFPRICVVAMRRTHARKYIPYLINFVNTQLPKTLPQYLALV